MPVVSASGAHHTLTQIRDHARANLGETDSSNTFWTDAVLTKQVNQVLYQLALKGIVVRKTYTTSVAAGNQTYTPQADVWKIERLDLTDRRLVEIYEPDMDTVTGEDWDSRTGRPARWYDDGVYVRFDCVLDDTETLNVWYWAVPTELSADSDQSSLYRVMLPLVIDGVCLRACIADKDSERASIFKALFDEGIQDALYHMQKPNESDVAVCRDPHGGWL